jgi:hypothetical protein
MDLKEVGTEAVNYIHLAKDKNEWQALVKTVVKLRRGFCFSQSVSQFIS